jgi:DNA ligase (NAD+)
VHAAIQAAGGVVHKSITKKTDFLVTGEKVGQAKLTKAERLGVRTIDEEGLAAMMEGGRA